MKDDIRNYFSRLGKKGGKSKSKTKLEAVRANLDKARANRWRKKSKAA